MTSEPLQTLTPYHTKYYAYELTRRCPLAVLKEGFYRRLERNRYCRPIDLSRIARNSLPSRHSGIFSAFATR